MRVGKIEAIWMGTKRGQLLAHNNRHQRPLRILHSQFITTSGPFKLCRSGSLEWSWHARSWKRRHEHRSVPEPFCLMGCFEISTYDWLLAQQYLENHLGHSWQLGGHRDKSRSIGQAGRLAEARGARFGVQGNLGRRTQQQQICAYLFQSRHCFCYL